MYFPKIEDLTGVSVRRFHKDLLRDKYPPTEQNLFYRRCRRQQFVHRQL